MMEGCQHDRALLHAPAVLEAGKGARTRTLKAQKMRTAPMNALPRYLSVARSMHCMCQCGS